MSGTRESADKKRFLTRRGFLLAAGTGGIGAAGLALWGGNAAMDDGPGMAVSNTFPGSTASLKVRDPARIRLLQMTDVHFFCAVMADEGWKDPATVALHKRLIEKADPDLVIMTGDVWHNNPEGRGAEFMRFFVDHCGSLGLPWTYVWGNHDRLDDYRAGHDAIHEGRNSLYRGGPLRGFHTVDLLDCAGKRVWELIGINTNWNGYDARMRLMMHRLNRLRAHSSHPACPAFVFQHIPFAAWERAWNAGKGLGVKLHANSEENDFSGRGMDVLKAPGTVRAAFCGHKHLNDYSTIAEGIELVYGRSSGLGAYGFDKLRKGAKLITVNAESGQYVHETIFEDGLRWRPEEGQRIEKVLDTPFMLDPYFEKYYPEMVKERFGKSAA